MEGVNDMKDLDVGAVYVYYGTRDSVSQILYHGACDRHVEE
jgi:hypothetical protein